ncbi:MAG: hypothetical protein HY661_07665 [Betaproteobacteria bacterium]|nr:hypothetical protein [Betaproteobacteria bacterium]
MWLQFAFASLVIVLGLWFGVRRSTLSEASKQIVYVFICAFFLLWMLKLVVAFAGD